MRLFGGDRIQNLMEQLGLDEDTPIENRLITSTPSRAPRRSSRAATSRSARTC
jgi:preprotein translocase subunit SecA